MQSAMKSFIILFFTIIVLVNPNFVTSYSRRCNRRNVSSGARNCPIVKCQPKICGKKICPKKTCLYGEDPNDCSCCPSCLKLPGEVCGGIKNVAGNCIKGSQCVADVDGIEKCVKCRCELVRCGGPEFLGCQFGSELDPVCGCCPVCLKGVGEECGPTGNCERGLVCKESLTTFSRGICVKANCPNCAATLCLAPESLKCKFGVELDPVCGCCHVCLKGPGESCGGRHNLKGNCGEGLVCVPHRGRSSGICSYIPSSSTPPQCDLSGCKGIVCALFVCPFGNDPLACTCCPTCLKGPGQCCGGPGLENGRCSEGFYCSDTNYQPIVSDNIAAPIGSCRSNSCPDCNLVDCRPAESLTCEKGITLDPFCKCCSFCTKGLGETCGGPSSVEGVCEEGLICETAPGRPVFQEGPDPPVGTCNEITITPPTDDCITSPSTPPQCDRSGCKDIACALFVCPFGNDPLACTCCPTCLKGPGQCCGGPGFGNGRCTEGFYCSDTNYQPIVSDNSITPIGSCRSNSCPDCRLVFCRPVELLNCENGTRLDPFCKCCSSCTKGLGETCGGPSSVEGVCEEGLICEIAPGRPVFQEGPDPPVGTCNEITINPPTDDCPDIALPSPSECPNCAATLCLSAVALECKYGSTIDPICGCCSVCLLGPGESCGGFRPFPIVDCGTGLRCHFDVNTTILPDASGVCVPI